MKRLRGRPVGTALNGRTRFLSDAELTAFFKVASRSKRDSFLFNAILFFGLRSREPAELKLSNFDFENLIITIRAVKNGLTRSYEEVPSELWHKLKMYLKVRKAHPKNPYLFPHRYLETAAMTAIGVQSLFKRICQKAGIKEHSVHDLRHSRGRQLALLNLSSNRIARHLRQKDSASANRYVDLANDREADEKIKQASQIF
jgi:integrase